MWFAGLLTGAFIGWLDSAAAGLLGAAVGAVVGAIVASALKARTPAKALPDIERRISHIYQSLEDIHRRLVRLEQAGSRQERAATAGDEQSGQTTPVSDVTGAPQITVPSPSSTLVAPSSASPPPVHAPAAPAALDPATAAALHVEPAVAPEPLRDPFIPGGRSGDTPFTHAAASWWQRLFAGNIVAKVGVVILFFGVGFLLKYAYEHAVLPVPLRLAGVAAAGLALIYVGWRLRATRRTYGLILQGAGIGLLYLDVFFALRVFALIHTMAGFALFTVLGVAATLLAVRQDAKALAVLGLSGAFLAPVLAGSPGGEHVLLFSYYTLLNGFIVAISWFKSWRDLNLTGFIFTFVIGAVWGATSYRPELFATVEPFVLVFFAMYLVIPILFAARQPPELKGLVDGTLVFGTPLAAAFMQAALVRDLPYGLAWSAGFAAALYALAAALVIRRAGMRLLGEAYVALAVVFATMTVFFALDAYPTFALWTLEGAAIVWVAARQKRLLPLCFGLALQSGGAALFLLHSDEIQRSNPWFNDLVLGCLLVAAAGMISAWLVHKHGGALLNRITALTTAILVWASGWWFAGGLVALHDGVPLVHFHASAMIFTAASFVLAETFGSWLAWRSLRLLTFMHLPAIVFGLLTIGNGHPLAGLGVVAWPLNFVVLFWCLHWQQRDAVTGPGDARYGLGWLTLAGASTWEAVWLLDHHRYRMAWALGALGIIAAGLRFHLRERERGPAPHLSVWVLLWGVTFWLLSGFGYFEQRFAEELHVAAGLAYVAGSCALFEIVGAWLRWNALRRAQLLLLPAMAAAMLSLDWELPPSADYGWLGWSAAFIAFYAILQRHQRAGCAFAADIQHVIALWSATALLAAELAWRAERSSPGTSWAFAMWGLVPAVVLAVVARYGKQRWPWRADFAFHRNACLGPIALYLVGWFLFAVADASQVGPLPYLPLANPIDAAQAMTLLAWYAWCAAAGHVSRMRDTAWAAPLAGLAFIWANAVVLRSIHHWFGVPYLAHALFDSIVVQAALSLLWTIAAMALMISATRIRSRKVWVAGVFLLTVVVAKLFLLDLANSGTVARIVSFLGVGALVMLIGYVAPVPPGDAERQAG